MLKGFQKPKRLEWERESATKFYGKFIAEPFERGFGTTLGNSLRRVLLSSLEGAAVTAVQIDGVFHEFSTIPGVVEDVVDIILNLKELRLKMHVDGPKTIYINAKGQGKIKAEDITTDADVEILNPELHIATLTKEGKLDVEMTVKKGHGYVSAERNRDDGQPAQVIPIDAIFTPIKRVNFKVDTARVGQLSEYDRLTLEVETDGSIAPEDAVAQAAKILKDHIQIFINFEEEAPPEEPEVDKKRLEMLANLEKSIEELELSVRAYNCLKNADIKTIRDLVQKTEAEMLKTRNFGRKSLNEIKEILEGMNLRLGMNLEELGLVAKENP